MVALLNAPHELAVSRKLIGFAKDRLDKLEHQMTRQRQSHEQYLDMFARADELRALIERMEQFVAQKEREN